MLSSYFTIATLFFTITAVIHAQDAPLSTTLQAPSAASEAEVPEVSDFDVEGTLACSSRGSVCQTMKIPGKDEQCFSYECFCALYGTDEFRECMDEKCPGGAQQFLDFCENNLGLATSGTPSNDFQAGPSQTLNVTVEEKEDEGLSTSDKIALGIGIGFGVPTLGVAVGAWLCARQRRARRKTISGDPTNMGSYKEVAY